MSLFRSWGSMSEPTSGELFQFDTPDAYIEDIWSRFPPLSPTAPASTDSSSFTLSRLFSLSRGGGLINPNNAIHKFRSAPSTTTTTTNHHDDDDDVDVDDVDDELESSHEYDESHDADEDDDDVSRRGVLSSSSSSSAMSEEPLLRIGGDEENAHHLRTAVATKSGQMLGAMNMQLKCLLLDGRELVAKDRIFDLHLNVRGIGDRSFTTDPSPERFTPATDGDGPLLVLCLRMVDDSTGRQLHPDVAVSVKKPLQTTRLCFRDNQAVLNLVIRGATVSDWPPIRKHQRRTFRLLCWLEERSREEHGDPPFSNKVTETGRTASIQFAGNRRIASKAETTKVIPWKKFLKRRASKRPESAPSSSSHDGDGVGAPTTSKIPAVGAGHSAHKRLRRAAAGALTKAVPDRASDHNHRPQRNQRHQKRRRVSARTRPSATS